MKGIVGLIRIGTVTYGAQLRHRLFSLVVQIRAVRDDTSIRPIYKKLDNGRRLALDLPIFHGHCGQAGFGVLVDGGGGVGGVLIWRAVVCDIAGYIGILWVRGVLAAMHIASKTK